MVWALVGLFVAVLAGTVGVALYGRSQPLIVEDQAVEPVTWLLNGMEHFTRNVNDGGDQASTGIESSDADPFWEAVGGVLFVSVAVAGFATVGWLVWQHRRRQG